MTAKPRPCAYSYEPLVGPEVRTAQHGDPVQCPRCDRALKVFRRWGDGAVARYPRHAPAVVQPARTI